ncbi:RNA 2',3'-cyclic phosphodiesterase [Tautonia plasticadhaerens]|uniref:RNA 2',3'-cyclic phosphodiesterase n=1 Tax=Tautonia plasticadhaerens TaxID=2527974 RepID=A0A518GYW9_9BACT|nr:RNA 2',3'-cyclic phosphodiesterase [Tautonia plasticadhaerens]QDV33804.1 2',5' RNA ligase family [Tautonia plasticadhaerens]
MAGTTRTFIAVPLPEQTRLAVERLQESLRGEFPGLRLTASRQLHLTLAFLGDVPTGDLDRLCDAVSAAVAPLPPFELVVGGLGAFPNPARARVLWAGIAGEALPRLDELHREVLRAARSVGHPPDDLRFHPHVTVARSKAGRGPGPDARPACEAHRAWLAGPLPIGTVETVASVLTRDGPVYSVLRPSPLIGSSA